MPISQKDFSLDMVFKDKEIYFFVDFEFKKHNGQCH